MSFARLQFRPGINREVTSFANEGGWIDCDKIRFQGGFPETIGGWVRFTNRPLLGVGRSMHPWVSLQGSARLGVGTNLKYYVVIGGTPNDITPLRLTTAAGVATFSATAGSSLVEVSHTAHGANAEDFVTFAAAASLGGNVTADVLNREHQIVQTLGADAYTIQLDVTANASDTGTGGSLTIAEYQVNTGPDSVVLGTGWGSGTWSRSTWGSGSGTGLSTGNLRLWSQGNFGEDLIFCARDGGIFYWSSSVGIGTRGFNIAEAPGEQRAPRIARRVMVSEQDRHVIAFGCDPEFDPGVQDPLIIRFSSQEDVLEWRSLPTNTAGELRIGTGSGIVTAVQTKQQILVLTDISAHTMQFVGAPFTFGISEVSTNISIVGPNAAIAAGDIVYWMGQGEFYAYDGTVRQIDCPVRSYVFDGLNNNQREKVAAGHNAAFGEIWWLYPSAGSQNNNSYVVYNYMRDVWYYGTIERTAWIDRGIFRAPLALAADGMIYFHETGLNDGSQNPPAPIHAYIESSPVDISEGDQFMFAYRMLPDITFRNSTSAPQATFTLKAQRFPGGPQYGDQASLVSRVVQAIIEQFTTQTFVRIRGRAIALRVESNTVGTAWRLGVPRLDIRTDGRR